MFLLCQMDAEFTLSVWGHSLPGYVIGLHFIIRYSCYLLCGWGMRCWTFLTVQTLHHFLALHMLAFSGAAATNNSAAVLFEYGNEWQVGKQMGPTCLLNAVIKRHKKISANCQPQMITTNNLELYCSQGKGWQNRSLKMTMGSMMLQWMACMTRWST